MTDPEQQRQAGKAQVAQGCVQTAQGIGCLALAIPAALFILWAVLSAIF